MRDLNPVGREGNTLLLTSDDGEQFSVAIDEALVRTIKEHRVPDGSGEPLSPRQIQDAIRAGETITEIAERSGTSLSLVERFAHPVLEELKHIVDLALSIRVELPADRFNEVGKKEFGQVISENLENAGASGLSWSAKRTENSVWEVSVSYELEGSTGSATWTFDPKRYQLTPETSNAQSLSKPESHIDSPLRETTRAVAAEHPSNSDSVVTAEKLEAFRSRRAKAEVSEEPSDIPESEETAHEPIEEIELEVTTTVTSITQTVDVVPEDLGEESQERPVESPKKSRAPMPSWDQIVRGTQSDDGEAF